MTTQQSDPTATCILNVDYRSTMPVNNVSSCNRSLTVHVNIQQFFRNIVCTFVSLLIACVSRCTL